MGHSYRDLVAWQKAVDLVVEVYRITRSFPKDEAYGLTSQLRRAAVSVPSNIAEGQGRLSKGEFRQFLGHARGSVLEVETQAIIAHKLGFLENAAAENVLSKSAEVNRILNGLLESLET
jgi:four helix bundle protein